VNELGAEVPAEYIADTTSRPTHRKGRTVLRDASTHQQIKIRRSTHEFLTSRYRQKPVHNPAPTHSRPLPNRERSHPEGVL
jgi:hypothetical protein